MKTEFIAPLTIIAKDTKRNLIKGILQRVKNSFVFEEIDEHRRVQRSSSCLHEGSWVVVNRMNDGKIRLYLKNNDECMRLAVDDREAYADNVYHELMYALSKIRENIVVCQQN